MQQLKLPRWYKLVEIKPFDRLETAENVRRVWDAPSEWTDDFHHFSGGIPRVQAYAFDVGSAEPSTALDRLRLSGKSLDQIFEQIFASALAKNGGSTGVAKVCAALVALPRPVPLIDLAGVLGCSPSHAADVCADLAPGIRVHDDVASFADEDFEHFVRSEGAPEIESIQEAVANWLLPRTKMHRYAAQNIAAALVAARRGNELLELIERESEPTSITDPVLRREVQVQRLRLAIRVCREAGDVSRALRFVLIGAEGIKTESALLDLLANNPDMAANFAQETAGRLILADSHNIASHGPLLFQRLSVDARRQDTIAVREGRRRLSAWLRLRHDRIESEEHPAQGWDISISDICAGIDAELRCRGADAAISELRRWRPKRIGIKVGLTLPAQLIAEGRADDVQRLVASRQLGPVWKLLLTIPLALAGRPYETKVLAGGLAALARCRLRVDNFFDGYQESESTHARVLDLVLIACEILTSRAQATELVDRTLARFLLPKIRTLGNLRPYESVKLDLLIRAFVLNEVRQGRTPSAKALLLPRPAVEGNRHASSFYDRDDRSLAELTGSMFGVYLAIANCLVHEQARGDLNGQFGPAIQGLVDEQSWIAQREGFPRLRQFAARSTQVLLAAGCDSHQLQSTGVLIHGNWRSGNSIPDKRFVARMSLRQELHGKLIADLAAGANATRRMRIGAAEKSEALVGYARLLLPVSAPDANAVFNHAVEAASDLDREVMAQICLLDKLVARGASVTPNARQVARRLADIIADAAIRLDGDDHFPWKESMSALTRLDMPFALANAARWDDEGRWSLHDTLPALITTAMRNRTLDPGQGAVLALFFDRNRRVLMEALELSRSSGLPVEMAIAEEAAHDELVHNGSMGAGEGLLALRLSSPGVWMEALGRQREFLSRLAPETTQRYEHEPAPSIRPSGLLGGYVWEQNVLSDSVRLQAAILALRQQERDEHRYLSAADIFLAARARIQARDYVGYLSAIAHIDDPSISDEAIKELLGAIEEWWGSPSVGLWCKEHLPGLIVDRMPVFARYIEYDEDNLAKALRRTSLDEGQLQDLVLQGIEKHVDAFGSDRIFALAGLAGGGLTPAEAADLTQWYVKRLADRIELADRDQSASDADIPGDSHEAVARFIFAYMGDFDVRMRWRAAHAVRRLARLGDQATLAALPAQYERREDCAFRSRELPFYWLGARLWFVIAWDRVASECPRLAAFVGDFLLEIALDEGFPHLLVRSFARDACERLVACGLLVLSPTNFGKIRAVNESPLPRQPSNRSCHRGFANSDAGRRFEFGTIDTLPYWYRPLLNAFANVDEEKFLQSVEAWIIDRFGYRGDIRAFSKELRGSRLDGSNWSLTNNSHGSLPTLERLNTHLEWHGMWCAAGDLLKTEPLALSEYDESDDWDGLSERIKRQKLTQPPLWSADLLSAIPLVVRNWRADTRAVDQWAVDVREVDHREEMLPPDRPEFVVIDAHAERRSQDREETIRVASSLVSPNTSGALLRALQTMRDAWDYKLPDEGEDHEIDHGPYKLTGWLRTHNQDGGIDEKDPFRGYASHINSVPGQRVAVACNLRRDNSPSPCWFSGVSEVPMFAYECWGEAAEDDERHEPNFSVRGERLLVHKRQLQDFLKQQGLDLIVKVEVVRRGRTRQFTGEKDPIRPEGRFDRLYLLKREGNLEVAEGRLDTWSDDRP